MLTAALLFFVACAPDTADMRIDGEPVDCGDGFGRADDGNCYPLEGDADESYADVTCEGDLAHFVTVDIGGAILDPGTHVESWGMLPDVIVDLCASERGDSYPRCGSVGPESAWVPTWEPASLSDSGLPVVYCERFWSGSDGYEYDGFAFAPIRVYFPTL